MYHFTQRNTRVIMSFYFTQFTFQQLPEILKLTSPLQSIQSYQMFFLLSWSRSECSFTYSANCQGQTSVSKTAILMENHKSVTKRLPQRQKVLEYSFIHSNVSCSCEWLLLLLNWWNSVCCWKNVCRSLPSLLVRLHSFSIFLKEGVDVFCKKKKMSWTFACSCDLVTCASPFAVISHCLLISNQQPEPILHIRWSLHN